MLSGLARKLLTSEWFVRSSRVALSENAEVEDQRQENEYKSWLEVLEGSIKLGISNWIPRK